MLKRLYVHNYKCLVNFEINFDKDISLFLGANGSGKSTIFEVLTKLRRLIVDEEKVENVFEETDIPRWLKQSNIGNTRFELDIKFEDSLYKYLLILDLETIPFRIIEETLMLNDKFIFDSKEGEISIESNEGIRSGLYRKSKAYFFVSFISDFFITRINPFPLTTFIKKNSINIYSDFSNYAEWFVSLNEKNRRGVSKLENALRDILPGFDYFHIHSVGQFKGLQVEFENKFNKNDSIIYGLHELSEGQKVLIALYTLIYCTPDNSLICIDEPENFLALPEIQPWFDALYDQCAERNLQVILISHHPKIINFLASDSGYWFSRENNLTRVQKIVPENESGLSIAELVERGWIYEH
jgi:AAA15 family ATPase/GTPase